MSRLRAVILTAETASDADIAMIERVFGARAVIEYGAAETGLVAMSRERRGPSRSSGTASSVWSPMTVR